MSLKTFTTCIFLGLFTISEAQSVAQNSVPDVSISIYGLPIGKPFEIPENEKKVFPIGKEKKVVYGLPKTVCFDRNQKQDEVGQIINETVTIRFPFDKWPQYVSGVGITGRIIEGNLEGIEFNTSGYSTQESVFNILKTKFGTPTHVLPKEYQNLNGAKFKSFVSIWERPDFNVIFEGIYHQITSGLVIIETERGKRSRTIEDDSLNENTLKM